MLKKCFSSFIFTKFNIYREEIDDENNDEDEEEDENEEELSFKRPPKLKITIDKTLKM